MSTYTVIEQLANTFHSPLTSELFFSVRYVENIHLYFWLLKDLAWSLRYTDFGMTFGTIAVLWLGVLYYNAIKARSTEEMFFLIPSTLWLIGNYLWMMGELENNDDDVYRPKGKACMITGIIIVIAYHIGVKWLKLFQLQSNEHAEKLYNEAGLKSRFEYFSTFRQYEHFHMLCWLGKDLCWNADIQVLWALFVLPTFFISADFIYLTSKNPKMTIDMVHYISQFLWVTANICWAYQELFELSMTDKPQYLFNPNVYTFRWASSMLLTLAWLPLLILYCVWLPLTYFGKIKQSPPSGPTGVEMTETFQHPNIANKFPANINVNIGADDFDDGEVV
jgi:hypothetical protein